VSAMSGRTESAVRVIVPQHLIPDSAAVASITSSSSSSVSSLRYMYPGDYVVVEVCGLSV